MYQPVSKPLQSILKRSTVVGKKSLRSIISDVRSKAKGAENKIQQKMAVKTIRNMNAGKEPGGRRMGRLTMKALGAAGHLKERYVKDPNRGLRVLHRAMDDGASPTKQPDQVRALSGLKKEENPAARRVRARRQEGLREEEEAKREQERGIVRSVADQGRTAAHSSTAPTRSLGEQELESAAVSMGEVAARGREAERSEKADDVVQEPVEMLID